MMKHGDFTELAKYYVNRPGYSLELLKIVKDHIIREQGREEVIAADVGAGTGKLTENLDKIGVRGYAIEPNDAMREEGMKLFQAKESFVWSKGVAESTGLPDNSVDWVLMGSSFHWTDAPRAVEEFRRILKPGGFFTAIWNPRDIQRSELHVEIENMIYKEVPGLKRVSSGNTMTTEKMAEILQDKYGNPVFMECWHDEVMSTERYINIWRSVNDIQVQAGEEGFRNIIENIQNKLADYSEIRVPYKSRAWTAQVCK